MNPILELEEIRTLSAQQQVIRIPAELDVPVTPRVRQLIDTAEFRRLSRIGQLGLVSQVYPAATHSRFEHSLGVYRNSLLYLRQLAQHEPFVELVQPEDAQLLIVAALLHDLGHWPFCHPIEDMGLPGVPEHELFANSFLLEGEVADALRDEWGIQPRDVVHLLSSKPETYREKILSSVLSGPIDIDKMDYLYRDSLHAGVPYGMNFDSPRLISSLCLNDEGSGLAITEKGRTAAEMMVFARYVMFSEVYWHHTVRAATAMMQHAFFCVYRDLDLDELFRQDEHAFVATIRKSAGEGPASDLIDGLYGPKRSIYKTAAQFSYLEHRATYEQLARKPYEWLVALSEQFAERASVAMGRRVAPHEVLFDAPPAKLEVEFNVQVYYRREKRYRWLGDVSPVVKTLAKQQFDDFVKRVRLFVHPRLRDEFRTLDLTAMTNESLAEMEAVR